MAARESPVEDGVGRGGQEMSQTGAHREPAGR